MPPEPNIVPTAQEMLQPVPAARPHRGLVIGITSAVLLAAAGTVAYSYYRPVPAPVDESSAPRPAEEASASALSDIELPTLVSSSPEERQRFAEHRELLVVYARLTRISRQWLEDQTVPDDSARVVVSSRNRLLAEMESGRLSDDIVYLGQQLLVSRNMDLWLKAIEEGRATPETYTAMASNMLRVAEAFKGMTEGRYSSALSDIWRDESVSLGEKIQASLQYSKIGDLELAEFALLILKDVPEIPGASQADIDSARAATERIQGAYYSSADSLLKMLGEESLSGDEIQAAVDVLPAAEVSGGAAVSPQVKPSPNTSDALAKLGLEATAEEKERYERHMFLLAVEEDLAGQLKSIVEAEIPDGEERPVPPERAELLRRNSKLLRTQLESSAAFAPEIKLEATYRLNAADKDLADAVAVGHVGFAETMEMLEIVSLMRDESETYYLSKITDLALEPRFPSAFMVMETIYPYVALGDFKLSELVAIHLTDIAAGNAGTLVVTEADKTTANDLISRIDLSSNSFWYHRRFGK